MRGHGLVSSAGGLGAHDHVCWPFADGESFRRAALEFLSDGRRLGDTGLRVVSEATALGADPANRAALTRWESLADRYAASHPVAGLCGYDRQALPDELVADLAAVHPLARDASTLVPFRLFARPGALALEGDVDYFSAGALSRLLALTDWNEGELELDLSGLGFIDHHGVLALTEHQGRPAQHGVKLTIRGAPSWVRRICDVLGVAL